MLPSIGFPEMLVIVLLAIIFVGPKDLPQLMRTIGQWMARIRAMGNEFKSAFDDMGVDNEVASIRREIEEMKSMGKLDPELDDEMRALVLLRRLSFGTISNSLSRGWIRAISA